MSQNAPASRRVAPDALAAYVAALFEAAAVPAADARQVAEALVAADQEGVSSHGVMLVPMYLARLRAGSIAAAGRIEVVSERATTVVLDAGNTLGQISAAQAVALAAGRAAEYGMAAVSVRRAFHFGAASRWARRMAEAGCIGIAMSNTRPLMPAPGAAERLVGNNPLAIAMPGGSGGAPLVLDMATSASAMGKIRMAATTGRDIPADWATDAEGRPTTDPAAAIKGMLLPAAGAKGFGLALMVDLLCGALSGGGLTREVQPLYGDSSQPYNCAHFFLALHVPDFQPAESFSARVAEVAQQVRQAARAPGVDRLYTPGEREWQLAQDNAASLALPLPLIEELERCAAECGRAAPLPLQ